MPVMAAVENQSDIDWRESGFMPRVNLSAAEVRRKELSARIQYQMVLHGYDNRRMSKLIGVSEKTFITRKLHAPEEFTVSEIWSMEKVFGCRFSEPLKMEADA